MTFYAAIASKNTKAMGGFLDPPMAVFGYVTLTSPRSMGRPMQNRYKTSSRKRYSLH
jgi:hypothetical protein